MGSQKWFGRKMIWIKFFIASSAFFSCIFLSCSNESNSLIFFDQENSLRSQSTERSLQIIWTAENEAPVDDNMLENKTLEGSWVATTELSAEFAENIESLFITHFELDQPIYPHLQGFGSLNISIFPPPLVSVLDVFLKSLQTENIDVSVFIEGKSYLKTLIEYDFKPLPQLTTWILGEPFLIDGIDRLVFEIPIRFVFDTGFCNGFIYCANYDDVFKIEQLVVGELQK